MVYLDLVEDPTGFVFNPAYDAQGLAVAPGATHRFTVDRLASQDFRSASGIDRRAS